MKSSAPRATVDKADAPAADQGVALVDNRAVAVAQRQMQVAIDNSPRQVAQRQQAAAAAPPRNTTGLPDNLKAGVENLSGYSLDDVTVHYNSAKPAQLQAHAYAQGTDIHVAPGQEQHLPHEAWHVVQQKQGRVRPTLQMKGQVNVNDNAGLEKEADVMGLKSVQNAGNIESLRGQNVSQLPSSGHNEDNILQMMTVTVDTKRVHYNGHNIDVTRTKEVMGSIQVKPTTGRGPAPDPAPFSQIEKHFGLPTGELMKYGVYDKGHVMALELGGDDVAENIVPQWGNWQRTGGWRKNEVLAKKGKNYKVVVEYGGRETGLGPLIPTDFIITIDGKENTLGNEPDQGDLNEAPKMELRYNFEKAIVKKIQEDIIKVRNDLTQKGVQLAGITVDDYKNEVIKFIINNYPSYKKPTPADVEKAKEIAKEVQQTEGYSDEQLQVLIEHFIGMAGDYKGIKGARDKALVRASKIYDGLKKKADDELKKEDDAEAANNTEMESDT